MGINGNAYGTRDDCTRDNRATILPNASLLGFSTNEAKRGSWVLYEHMEQLHAGRVVGRVHCEGTIYLEIITTDAAMTFAAVRWINPTAVKACFPAPNRQVFEFLMGEWTDADKILTTANNGFSREYT